MWNKIADGAIALSSIGCSVVAVILASAWLYYRAGLSNASGSSPLVQTLLLLLAGIGLGVCMLVIGLLRFRRWRWSNRSIWFLLLLLPWLCGIVTNLAAADTIAAQRYIDGFQRWAAEDVDAPAIRAWLSTRAPVVPVAPNLVSTVAPADWPKAIASRHPIDVSESPDGIFMTWGQFGTWGDQRQIFIGRALSTPVPTVVFWGREWRPTSPSPVSWISITPGSYVWAQSGG